MSQTTENDGQAKLAASVELLHAKVYVPAFFGTLADLGHAPTSEKQAQAYLRIGQRLLLEEQAQGSKQAAAHEDFVVAAADHLDHWLGGGQAAAPGLDGHAIKRAAAEYGNDPELVAAALLLQDACLGAR